ncbi:copper homeostasis periplasmic binding protein CopC [Labrys okinawensis]|uniref:copper homeostasis periplasmic binding protein CopC n=1 Tax=Labrys okinawensis TaxID=346911 RepID=UPI0039BC2E66
MSKIVCSVGFAALIGLAATGSAFAHAHLKSAVPAVNGTVDKAPTELDLTFTEDLNLKFSGVTVTGPDKAVVQTGTAMLMEKNTVLMVPLSGTLGAGTYTVSWHALSGDGHKTNGSYKFTVKP